VSPPRAVAEFADDLAAAVADVLGEQLVGVYLVGSAAVGDFGPTSDIDVAAVVTDPLTADLTAQLSNTVLTLADGAPARGVEFVAYTAAQAANPDGSVELNINAGPEMVTQVGSAESFWFTLDIANLRDTAIALVGRSAREVFGEIDRPLVVRAAEQSLRWHATAGDRPHATVLTACRVWHYISQGDWCSKSTAGAWAAARAPDVAPLIAAALAFRRGETTTEVPVEAAAAFAQRVRAALEPDPAATDAGSAVEADGSRC
jgi:streptomycin 3"-adenylyltransferase